MAKEGELKSRGLQSRNSPHKPSSPVNPPTTLLKKNPQPVSPHKPFRRNANRTQKQNSPACPISSLLCTKTWQAVYISVFLTKSDKNAAIPRSAIAIIRLCQKSTALRHGTYEGANALCPLYAIGTRSQRTKLGPLVASQSARSSLVAYNIQYVAALSHTALLFVTTTLISKVTPRTPIPIPLQSYFLTSITITTMATRRPNATPLTAQEEEYKQPLGQPSITAPAVPMWVPHHMYHFMQLQ